MQTFMNIVHVMTALFLILVVLMQSGKGADISASLGGSSQTIFGSSGGANFFTRLTSILAAIFMATSLGLTVMGAKTNKSIFDGAPVPAQSAPATQDAPANAAAAPANAAPAAPVTPAKP
jgi:preprotein translocase subunit SecG